MFKVQATTYVTDKGLTSRIYKGLSKLNTEKNNLVRKWARYIDGK